MDIVKKIDQRCASTLPYYTDLSQFTTQKYQEGLAKANSLYACSNNKVKQVTKLSKQFRSDIIWILSQATTDILELIEKRFSLSTKVKGKTERLLTIYNSLKEETLQPYLEKILEMNEKAIVRGKKIHQENIYPLYLKVKATVEVSREIILEILLARLTQLKMSYECSKDSITMFCSGEFKEEQLVEKVKDKFGCLKQFTVSFVQKGMEIKISKKDLTGNYHLIMEKLAELMKQVGEKGASQWTETKTKTIDLYQTVLRRIKEKERMLTIKPEPLKTTQSADEAKSVSEEQKQSEPEAEEEQSEAEENTENQA